jgi:hypothetical protein
MAKKELKGRAKGNVKDEAIAKLAKGATPDQIATVANGIAKAKGYEPSFTAEWIADHLAEKPSKSKPAKAGGGYTIAQVLALKKTVDGIADEAGGKEKLEAILKAIDDAGGAEAVKEILGTPF